MSRAAATGKSPRSKRHHYVPECYLKKWADSHTRVAMRRRPAPQAIVTHIRNVAVEADLYTVGSAEEPSDQIETALAELEEPLQDALAAIIAGQIPTNNSRDRQYLASFMAIQQSRTPENLERFLFPARAAEHSGELPISKKAMARYLEEVHLGFAPSDAEVSAARDFANYALRQGVPDKQTTLQLMFQIALKEIAPRLRVMSWSLEHCSKPRLITTDRPVALWRPPSPENRFMGVGIEGAHEVRFPVSPRDVLVLRPEGAEQVVEVSPSRGSEISEHLARQCHQLVVAPTDRTHYLRTLELAPRRPALRFNTGPLITMGPDGNLIEQGEIIHTWVPDSD